MRLKLIASAAALGLASLSLTACIGVDSTPQQTPVYVVPPAPAPTVVCSDGTAPPCP